jgi:hypothetical protein
VRPRLGLLGSAAVQGLTSLLFFFLVTFLPGQDCREYRDCAGEALALTFIVMPLLVFALLNLAVSFMKMRIIPVLVSMASWVYFAYWFLFVPLIIVTEVVSTAIR